MAEINTYIGVKVPDELKLLQPYSCPDLIRVGRLGDGGYILPAEIVRQTKYLLSLGIEDEWSFDTHFKELNSKVHVIGYDHTVSVRPKIFRAAWAFLNYTKKPNNVRLQYFKISLNQLVIYVHFWMIISKHYRERIIYPAASRHDTSLKKAIERLKKCSPDSLCIKMDIEGSEYSVIENFVEKSNLISGMVIEFHNVSGQRKEFITAIELLQTKYDIIHVHGNNHASLGSDNFPDVIEITWVKKGVITLGNKRSLAYIDGIDSPNDNTRPDYLIEF